MFQISFIQDYSLLIIDTGCKALADRILSPISILKQCRLFDYEIIISVKLKCKSSSISKKVYMNVANFLTYICLYLLRTSVCVLY